MYPFDLYPQRGLRARLLKFLNDRSPVFFLTTSEYCIGDSSEEIYYGFLYARRTGRKIQLLHRKQLLGAHSPISNQELFKIRTPYSACPRSDALQWLGNLALTLLTTGLFTTGKYVRTNLDRLLTYFVDLVKYRIARAGTKPKFRYRHHWHSCFPVYIGMEHLWNPGGMGRFSWENSQSVDWSREFEEYLPVEVDPKKADLASRQLREMGILPGHWYVGLHVREGGFHHDHHNPRNGDIQDFIKAIQAIVAAGGWVVRMGDRSMAPLPRMERVIDYPFTRFKSDLMDLYLIQSCRFFIGLSSGLMDVAHLFQKQTVGIGVTELLMTPTPRSGTLAIPKHVFSKSLDRFLSIRELLDHLDWNQWFNVNEDYRFVDNTPDEIHELVLEKLAQLETPGHEHTALQKRFIVERKRMVLGLLNDSGFERMFGASYRAYQRKARVPHPFTHQKYQLASKIGDSRGTLGAKYLETNWDRDQIQMRT